MAFPRGERGRTNLLESDQPFPRKSGVAFVSVPSVARIREDDAERQGRHSHAERGNEVSWWYREVILSVYRAW